MRTLPSHPPRRFSIAAIVSCALAGLVTLVLLAFALLYYGAERQQRWDGLRRELAISADQLAVAAALPAWNFDDSQILAVMRSGLNHRDLYGSVLAATANKRNYILMRNGQGELVSATAIPADPALLVEARPIRVAGQVIGMVSVFATPRYLEDELRQRRVAMFGMILVLDLVLVLSVYVLLWYLMLAPIRSVGLYAGSVKAGGVGGPGPGKGFLVGEIHALSESIREMVALLDSRYLALRESEQRLAMAARAANIGIWDWDVVSGRLVWDEAMHRLFGVAPEAFTGDYQAWAATVLPEDLAGATAAVNAALRGEAEYRYEFRIVWPDGSLRHIAAEGLTTRDASGRALRMVGVNYDVTDKILAQQELQHHRVHLEDQVAERTAALSVAAIEAQAANRAKSVFLATMSHELRTPLNSVIGFARLMADSATMSREEKRNLAIIHRSGQHLLTLINDILELSKIEAGRVSLNQEPIDVGDLVQEVVDMVGARAAANGQRITLDCMGLPAAARADGAKLRQVLLNLMSNAVKFVGQGQVTLEVRGAPVPGSARHALAFAVRDNGIGIAPEDQARIFEPFVQADNGSKDGSGLGLAISREFVRLMGGALEVESSPGIGSVFRFRIEVEAVASLPLALATEVTALPETEHGKRVLVVDDIEDGRKLLVGLLEPLGFLVDEAIDGHAALDSIAAHRPDLVFMDWRMPGLDGIGATRRLRATAGAYQPKVVMLTASAFEEERLEALGAGADDFLRKPVDHEKLFLVIEQQLGLHFKRRQRVLEPARPAPLDAPAMQALAPALRGALRAALQELDLARVARLLEPARADHPGLVASIDQLLALHHYPQLCRLIDAADGQELV
ncbi:MAG: ATP-binding protein [Pseudomonadota bacterium]